MTFSNWGTRVFPSSRRAHIMALRQGVPISRSSNLPKRSQEMTYAFETCFAVDTCKFVESALVSLQNRTRIEQYCYVSLQYMLIAINC